jgi:hypothetical protein
MLWGLYTIASRRVLIWTLCIQLKIIFEAKLVVGDKTKSNQILFITCAEQLKTLQWNAYLQALNQQCSFKKQIRITYN